MDLLRQFAKKNSWQIVVEIDEAGPSFSTRRQRSTIMNAMRQGRVDVIVTTNVHCWVRSIHDLTRSLSEILAYKVAFQAISDSIAISGDNGLAVVHLLTVLQEWQSSMHGVKVKNGHALARLNGSGPGRPRSGDERTKNIRRLRQAGMSIKDIATRFKLSKASVYRLLAD